MNQATFALFRHHANTAAPTGIATRQPMKTPASESANAGRAQFAAAATSSVTAASARTAATTASHAARSRTVQLNRRQDRRPDHKHARSQREGAGQAPERPRQQGDNPEDGEAAEFQQEGLHHQVPHQVPWTSPNRAVTAVLVISHVGTVPTERANAA